jgi:hypothetical protein
VNPHWHYLLVNAGSDAGIKEGLQVQVMRDGQAIGTAVVTDLKPGQAVLDIETDSLSATGVYPRPGDHIALP